MMKNGKSAKVSLKKLTKKKLQTKAQSLGLKFADSLKKGQLIDLILKNSLRGEAADKSTMKTDKQHDKPAKTKTPVMNPPPKVETTEALIGASKFYEGPASDPGHLEAPQLPDSYNRNTLAMIVRDPYWSYAYWELTADHVEANKNQLNDVASAKMILRIYQFTDSNNEISPATNHWDITLVGNPNNWYIHLGTQDNSFQAEIGWLDNTGLFIALARSNAIHTPRDRMSDVVDEEWMTVDEEYEKIYRLSGGFELNSSSIGITELLAKRWQFDLSSGGISSFRSGQHPTGKKR